MPTIRHINNFIFEKDLGMKATEEYIYNSFVSGIEKIFSESSLIVKGEFLLKFSTHGERNFKLYLKEYGYNVDKDGYLDFYGTRFHSADLGNLLFGYLAEAGNIFEYSKQKAYEIEFENYRKYYGNARGDVRAKSDEKSDTIRYESGKEFYKELLVGKITKESFITKIKKYIYKTNLLKIDLDVEEKKKNQEICDATKGMITACFSYMCTEYITGYFTYNELGDKIVRPNCSSIGG